MMILDITTFDLEKDTNTNSFCLISSFLVFTSCKKHFDDLRHSFLFSELVSKYQNFHFLKESSVFTLFLGIRVKISIF